MPKKLLLIPFIITVGFLLALLYQNDDQQASARHPSSLTPTSTNDTNDHTGHYFDKRLVAATPTLSVIDSSFSTDPAQPVSPTLLTTDLHNIPDDVLDTVKDGLRNALAGNTEYAALLSIEAAEQLPENKAFAAQMYLMAGRYYEQLQFKEMAIAQYRLALTYIEKHPASYNSLRRLDSEFANQNPPLAKDTKNSTQQEVKKLTP